MSQMESLDTEPTEALVRGDQDAWQAFFHRHNPLIASVVAWPKWRFSPDVQADIAQNIRAAVVRAIGHLRSDQRMEPFLRRIAVNQCIDEVRRQIRERKVVIPLDHPDEDSGESAAGALAAGEGFDPVRAVAMLDRAAALQRLLASIDPLCQDAIRRFYLEERSYKDIAALQGVPVNTVGTRLSRCLQKLKQLAMQDSVLQDVM